MKDSAPYTSPPLREEGRRHRHLRGGHWTVEWVRERVNRGHHQALSKYLLKRTAAQAAEADSVGLTVNDIVRRGFSAENGHTSVPECAMKLLGVPGIDPKVVLAVCVGSDDKRVPGLLAKRVRHHVTVGSLSEEAAKAVLDELTVREVMES